MIRLSRMADYAVVAMSLMARSDGRVLTVPDLASRTGLPEPTVAKLMKSLTRAGLMTSRRGAVGGYALARGPGQITVADIIAAVDGPIALTACVDGASGGCQVESLCPRRGSWDRVNEAIRSALDGVTLADMAAPTEPDWREAVPATALEERY